MEATQLSLQLYDGRRPSLMTRRLDSGANYFFYYGATVFQSVGLSDSYVTQIILGAVNFVSTFGGLWIMNRFGRRLPLIIGGIWCSIWLLLYASIGITQDTSSKGTGDFLIVSSVMFIIGYATTWAPGECCVRAVRLRSKLVREEEDETRGFSTLTRVRLGLIGIWIIIGETFEPRNRARQASLAVSSNWIFNVSFARTSVPITLL